MPVLSPAALDALNAAFELAGAGLVWLNVRQLQRDREVRGSQVKVAAFFAVWGFWNLLYYPALAQPLSAGAAGILAAGNATWVALAIYYRRR